MASVISGQIPTLTVVKNNPRLNRVTTKLVRNLVDFAAVKVAVSQKAGDEVYEILNLNKKLDQSNFLQSAVLPNLPTLERGINAAIDNSGALGPFGPLAKSLAKRGIKALTDLALGKQDLKSFGGRYFPGAGGPGEGSADYPSANKQSVYTLGPSGPDVVFSIVPALSSAIFEAQKEVQAQAAASSKATPANPANPAGEGATATPSTAAPATAPSPGGSAAGGAQPTTAPSSPETVPPASPNPASGGKPKPRIPAAPTRAAIILNQQERQTAQDAKGSQLAPNPNPVSGSAAEAGTPGRLEQAAAAAQETSTTGNPESKPPEPPKEPEGAWKFICPPEEISWETTAQAERVPIFGANQAPVMGGVKGMRDLNLNNAIVEGFTRGKSIEQKVYILESLLDMTVSPDKSFVQIPVYRVQANKKLYGMGAFNNEQGFFVIKSIRVSEKMRDLSGFATRATVDITMTQVPSYQVDTGRDQASPFLASAKGPFAGIENRVGAEAAKAGKASLAAQASQGVNRPGTPRVGDQVGGPEFAPTPAAAPSPSIPAVRPNAYTDVIRR